MLRKKSCKNNSCGSRFTYDSKKFEQNTDEFTWLPLKVLGVGGFTKFYQVQDNEVMEMLSVTDPIE
jgi:hypothetical protein